MSYKVRFVVGDWSNDGHNYHKEYAYYSNYPVKNLQNAYKKSCKKIGLQFNINEDYTGILGKLSYEERNDLCVFASYEAATLSEVARDKLSAVGIKTKKSRYSKKEFLSLLFEFLKLSLPNLKLIEAYPDKKELRGVESPWKNFNGGWDNNLNIGIGYGLWTFPGVLNEKVKVGAVFEGKGWWVQGRYLVVTSINKYSHSTFVEGLYFNDIELKEIVRDFSNSRFTLNGLKLITYLSEERIKEIHTMRMNFKYPWLNKGDICQTN